MKIIEAKFIYIDNDYIQKSAVAFDKKIVEVGLTRDIKAKYPNAQLINFNGNSILYPGFINAHTHLEFSANRAKLTLGNFIEWLYSVFEYRDRLIQDINEVVMKKAIEEMLQSGVTTFGEISSFGADLQACKKAPQRVIFFNEVIGSNPAMIDTLFQDFKMRLRESESMQDDKLYPAIAIHSPYSVHPFLIREVLNIAKDKNLQVTAHFLESPQEREWLKNSSGDFLKLFSNFFKTDKPVNTIDGFLDLFKDINTLFTHATQATKEELDKINYKQDSIIHCPRSNRLLNCGKLDINSVNNMLLGTDGLSSNYSLSILDELKSAIMMHTNIELKTLALNLIKSVTSNPAKALNIKIGKIEENYHADFAIFKLPEDLTNFTNSSLAINTIIECNKADAVFIGGKRVL